jgi:DNA-binding GntR family transcriptional regulator
MTNSTARKRPLRPKSLGVEIVVALQRDIIGGKLKPGQRLVERELIRRFGVSSIPIREALQELQNRGLAVKRHNCGCSVIHLNRVEVARICELRRVLELGLPRVTRLNTLKSNSWAHPSYRATPN